MFEIFYPDYIAVSTYHIDFKRFSEEGVKGLIFDIDNTLVGHDAPADERVIAFFSELHSLGFKTVLLSNNREPRVKLFAEKVDSMYIFKANKPSKKGYIRAMELMGTDRSNTLFVGDQLFTDVWGAKRSGIKTVLVGPLYKHEEIQIVLKRILEKPILKLYRRSRYYKEVKPESRVDT